jgi:hypothetical protein
MSAINMMRHWQLVSGSPAGSAPVRSGHPEPGPGAQSKGRISVWYNLHPERHPELVSGSRIAVPYR